MKKISTSSGIVILAVSVLFSGCLGRSATPTGTRPPYEGNIEIVVNKSDRKMLVYADKRLVRTYRIGLGFNPEADKVKEGDGATPEGEFYIFAKNPESKYYLSLGISYPNLDDARRGLNAGLINAEQYERIRDAIEKGSAPPQDTPLGGEIYIHGRGSGSDWTWGCVALDDPDMKELFDAVRPGTKVSIRH